MKIPSQMEVQPLYKLLFTLPILPPPLTLLTLSSVEIGVEQKGYYAFIEYGHINLRTFEQKNDTDGQTEWTGLDGTLLTVTTTRAPVLLKTALYLQVVAVYVSFDWWSIPKRWQSPACLVVEDEVAVELVADVD